MQHWIIDSEPNGLPGWQEAMPDAKIVRSPGEIEDGSAAKVVWCRLRVGEELASILNGVDLTAGHPVVVLSDVPSDDLIMQSLAAGAAGCCNSRAAPEVLRQVGMVVGNGGLWVGHSLLQRLVGSTAKVLAKRPNQTKNSDWGDRLSERERQVAKLVASGENNKEVAKHLSISERTVKAHMSAILEKLGVRDRLQLSLHINGLSI